MTALYVRSIFFVIKICRAVTTAAIPLRALFRRFHICCSLIKDLKWYPLMSFFNYFQIIPSQFAGFTLY